MSRGNRKEKYNEQRERGARLENAVLIAMGSSSSQTPIVQRNSIAWITPDNSVAIIPSCGETIASDLTTTNPTAMIAAMPIAAFPNMCRGTTTAAFADLFDQNLAMRNAAIQTAATFGYPTYSRIAELCRRRAASKLSNIPILISIICCASSGSAAKTKIVGARTIDLKPSR